MSIVNCQLIRSGALNLREAEHRMPQFEEWRPQHLRGVAAQEPQVTSHAPTEESPLRHLRATLDALIIMSEVTRQHDLAEQEAPLHFVGVREQVAVIHGKHLLQHPHHRSREALHAQGAQRAHRLCPLLLREALVQHKVVVEQLAQTYPLMKQMTVYMYQDIHAVEGERRRGDYRGTFGAG